MGFINQLSSLGGTTLYKFNVSTQPRFSPVTEWSWSRSHGLPRTSLPELSLGALEERSVVTLVTSPKMAETHRKTRAKSSKTHRNPLEFFKHRRKLVKYSDYSWLDRWEYLAICNYKKWAPVPGQNPLELRHFKPGHPSNLPGQFVAEKTDRSLPTASLEVHPS